MKSYLLAAILVVGSSLCSQAQGTVNFNNRVLAASIDAPVFDVNGITRLEGSAFFAQLYAGTSLGTIAPIGAAVPFRTGVAAGYVDVGSLGDRTINSVAPGADAVVVIRAWDASYASYEIASTTIGAKAGESGALTIATGGAGTPPSSPANLVGLTSFSLATVVPEPSVIALGILGAAAVIFRRRKS